MRCLFINLALTVSVCTWLADAQSEDAPSITPIVELQSEPLTPGLTLDEFPRPVHQVRLLVDASQKHGVLILDGNRPEFDEFGTLVGGLQTPHVRAKGDPALIQKFECEIKPVKEGPKKWRLHRISGPKLTTALHVATRGSIAECGSVRMIVLDSQGSDSQGSDSQGSDSQGSDSVDHVKAVVPCTCYGLILP